MRKTGKNIILYTYSSYFFKLYKPSKPNTIPISATTDFWNLTMGIDLFSAVCFIDANTDYRFQQKEHFYQRFPLAIKRGIFQIHRVFQQ